MGEEEKVVPNINWSVCYDVEDIDMSTDVVWTELGACVCVFVCVSFEGLFPKAPHSPNMFLSVHFTKTEEVVHDLTQPAPCRFVTPKYRSSTSMRTLKKSVKAKTLFRLTPLSLICLTSYTALHTRNPDFLQSYVCTHSSKAIEN